jgi:hypothetical protein
VALQVSYGSLASSIISFSTTKHIVWSLSWSFSTSKDVLGWLSIVTCVALKGFTLVCLVLSFIKRSAELLEEGRFGSSTCEVRLLGITITKMIQILFRLVGVQV